MSRERGSVSLVVAAVVSVALVLSVGAVDLARVLVALGRAQSAADAAALAAAQELALPTEDDAERLAADYAGRNGAVLVGCRCVEGTFEAVVEVRVDVGRLLLVPGERSAGARARAVVQIPGLPAG